jgi:hypothetical protein
MRKKPTLHNINNKFDKLNNNVNKLNKKMRKERDRAAKESAGGRERSKKR